DQTGFRLAQLGHKIDRATFRVTPARAFPTRTDDEVPTSFDQPRHPVRLQIGRIAKAYLTLDDGYPVERLTCLLIGQLEVAKTLPRKIEGTVNAPQLIL